MQNQLSKKHNSMLRLLFCILAVAAILQKSSCVKMTGCTAQDPFDVYLDINSKGSIYSPGYQENETYPNNLYCLYTVQTHPLYKIKLTFKFLDIEPFDMCGKDMLFVHDGKDRESPVLNIFCGSQTPFPIISSANVIHLFFYTDFMAGRKGFQIDYEVTQSSNVCSKGLSMCRNRNCYDPQSKCNGYDDCGDGTDEEDCGHPLITVECGVQNIQPFNFSSNTDRIVGGMGAKQGSWPWQVDMQQKVYEPNGHTCGGTIINSQWAMTALHCLQSSPFPEKWRIHVGNHNKFTKDPYEQIRYVDKFIIFPDYTGEEIIGKPIDLEHDIALMKLNAPIVFSDYVRPACLPTDGHEVQVGTKCVVTGWGTTRGTGSNGILKQIDLTVRPGNYCGNSYEPTTICTRTEQGLQDSCHGDSGGPLSCKIGEKWNVVGIASYVTGTNLLSGACGMPETGSVYNKVSSKTSWIQETIERYS